MDENQRCSWANHDPLDMQYHDEEWGVPVYDDAKLFEMLVLESMQAGLSWSTILKKRETMRAAFDDFDLIKVSNYDDNKVEDLLLDSGIIRHRLKVKAMIHNATSFMKIQEEFGSFADYIWSYVDGKPIVNEWETMDQVPASTALSNQISKDLKKRGFKFLGTTTVYAYMQAMGIVNDHLVSCKQYLK